MCTNEALPITGNPTMPAVEQMETDGLNEKSQEQESFTKHVESTQSENTVEKAEEKKCSDPYAYVKSNVFTSEKFKLEIRGLPKYYGIKELRKFLNVKLQLNCNKVKATNNKRSPLAYACFRSEEERDRALDTLKNITWKRNVLSVKLSQPVPDPLVRKRNDHMQKSSAVTLDTEEKQEEAIKNSVSPLWNMSYEDQIAQKTKEARKVIKRLGMELGKNDYLKKWVALQKETNNGLVCKMSEMKCLSDNAEKYRNKCEFTIGKNDVTGKRTVGFRIGSYASGSLSVVSVEGIKLIPDAMMKAAKLFENYIQNSEYDVFSPETLQGYWKLLTVRIGFRTNQLMIIVGFHPQDLSEQHIQIVKENIKDYFSNGEGSTLNVNSLYFRLMPRSTKGENNLQTNPPELLLGEPIIEEVLCGQKFKISPGSFFQINTKCTELLINCMKDLIGLDRDTVLLDVCCGTGTLGLCLAKQCKRVLGIEIVEQAVKDAKENAEKNNIQNCDFFCGKADEILSSVANRVKDDNLIAILDPPRAGCHKNALHMIRKTQNLKKLVYLSCDSKSALSNFIELGRAPSKTLVGEPFLPIAAIPVDLFPQTNHFELVIFFERVNIDDFNDSNR